MINVLIIQGRFSVNVHSEETYEPPKLGEIPRVRDSGTTAVRNAMSGEQRGEYANGQRTYKCGIHRRWCLPVKTPRPPLIHPQPTYACVPPLVRHRTCRPDSFQTSRTQWIIYRELPQQSRKDNPVRIGDAVGLSLCQGRGRLLSRTSAQTPRA